MVAEPPKLFFRLTGRVADLDDTTPDEPEHPNLALITECDDRFARIVVPVTVWPLEKRELLAVDRHEDAFDQAAADGSGGFADIAPVGEAFLRAVASDCLCGVALVDQATVRASARAGH